LGAVTVASIDDIIRKSFNPFDRYKANSFWREEQDSQLVVDSIHTEVILAANEMLDRITADGRTKTLLISGESGSGKTYLLGRLKKALNSKAIFVYVGSCPNNDHIWRHTLRETVDSLVQIPEQQKDSQLLLWLKNLSVFKKASLKEKIFSIPIWELGQSDRYKGRQDFIKKLRNLYQKFKIFNHDEFFGVLYDLTDSELYPLACNWLRGDSLNDESLKQLKIKSSIQDEDTARKILANFGEISSQTIPIVICFDELDNYEKPPEGLPELLPLFEVNTVINNDFSNFLVIISIVTDTWIRCKPKIPQPNIDRINEKVELKSIDLDGAEGIWRSLLLPLHAQAESKLDSPIYPFKREDLEAEFPRGRLNPRDALISGFERFKVYKQSLLDGEASPVVPIPIPQKDSLSLVWIDEFNQVKQKIIRVDQLASIVLLDMLKESMQLFQVSSIQPKVLPSKTYESYSFRYTYKSQHMIVVWSEHLSKPFFDVMSACKKMNDKGENLYLIHSSGVGDSKSKGYQVYRQVFANSRNCHITPDLNSIHYINTYYNLLKSSRAGDLVIGGKVIGGRELVTLVREGKFLEECQLLHKLLSMENTPEPSKLEKDKKADKKVNSVVKPPVEKPNEANDLQLKQLKDFVFSAIKTQQLIGIQLLIKNAASQFPEIEKSQIEQVIKQLCLEKQAQIVNPNQPLKDRLICLVIPKK
jgi:GTPase SAR1 family protein